MEKGCRQPFHTTQKNTAGRHLDSPIPSNAACKMGNPSMTMSFRIVLILLLGMGAWGLYQFRRQDLRIQNLKQSLLEINRQTHQQDVAHEQDKACWEQTEEKLRGFLKLMDTLMNTIPNPIYFEDADGICRGCNRVFAKQTLGLSRDRIIGKRLQELPGQVAVDLATAFQREEFKMTDETGFQVFEARVQCANGMHRDFLFSLAPVMDHKGKLDGRVAVLSDLTDKNRAAQDRMEKKKLEGVLETAGAVCHEFNQPLQAISGYTELMAMKLGDHEARHYIENLTTQIERMRDITDKLQGVTRYETKAYAGKTRIIDIQKASKKISR